MVGVVASDVVGPVVVVAVLALGVVVLVGELVVLVLVLVPESDGGVVVVDASSGAVVVVVVDSPPVLGGPPVFVVVVVVVVVGILGASGPESDHAADETASMVHVVTSPMRRSVRTTVACHHRSRADCGRMFTSCVVTAGSGPVPCRTDPLDGSGQV